MHVVTAKVTKQTSEYCIFSHFNVANSIVIVYNFIKLNY